MPDNFDTLKRVKEANEILKEKMKPLTEGTIKSNTGYIKEGEKEIKRCQPPPRPTVEKKDEYFLRVHLETLILVIVDSFLDSNKDKIKGKNISKTEWILSACMRVELSKYIVFDDVDVTMEHLADNVYCVKVFVKNTNVGDEALCVTRDIEV